MKNLYPFISWIIFLFVIPIISWDGSREVYELSNIPLVAGWLQIVYYIIYIIVMVLITWLTMDTGASFPSATAREFSSPQLTASAPIPILFGTQYIRGMNTVWYGSVKATPWEKCS